MNRRTFLKTGVATGATALALDTKAANQCGAGNTLAELKAIGLGLWGNVTQDQEGHFEGLNDGISLDYDPRSLRKNGVRSFTFEVLSHTNDQGLVVPTFRVTADLLTGQQLQRSEIMRAQGKNCLELETDFQRGVWAGAAPRLMEGSAVPGSCSQIVAVDTGNCSLEVTTYADRMQIGKTTFNRQDPAYDNPDYPYLALKGSVAVDHSTRIPSVYSYMVPRPE